MRLFHSMTIMAAVAVAAVPVPSLADPGRGPDKHRGNYGEGYRRDCPPGLAKKNPPCVPPGQARKSDDRYYPRVGDVLRVGDYVVIRDPRRLDLEPGDGWRYYREGDRAYRVDSETRKILSVIQLMDAFSD
jgi:hypothetical protein